MLRIICLKTGRQLRPGILATNVLNQLSFSCERMAGFGVKKSCVHQNPLVFSPAAAGPAVLFQTIVFAAKVEFWAIPHWILPDSPPFCLSYVNMPQPFRSFLLTPRRSMNGRTWDNVRVIQQLRDAPASAYAA